MVLRYSGAQFARVAGTDSEVERIAEQLLYEAGLRVSASERRSWHRSHPVIARDLVDAGLGDVEVLVEHRFPLSSHRADVVVAGIHPTTREPSYVVVELKQWSGARTFENDPHLVTVDGLPSSRAHLHPLRQVGNYVTYITDFTRALEPYANAVAGIAYLHNARGNTVADLHGYIDPTGVRLFTADDRARLHDYLRSRFAPEPGSDAADLLLHSAVAPSRQLLAHAAAEIRDREQFVLLGNQQLAVDLVHHEVRRARAADRKRVIVVSGGPGSGKSVVALSLLGELSREGRTVMHATGSRSFTRTLRQVAGRRSRRVQQLFRYFNQFMDAEKNGLDVLVLDEAHRIRETSVNRFTRAQLRSTRPQLDELVSAARVPVFLLDQNQVVRQGELGSVELIRRFADDSGLDVVTVELGEQFRCGGSAAYVDWVQALLGLDGAAPRPWAGDPAFAVELADSPFELEALIRSKSVDGYTGRLTAGFCWPWSEPVPGRGLVPDVRIGDWEMPWNVKGDVRVGEAPPSALWATEPGGIDQVGCIYTAQGFEYDWNGVIIGPDLVWRDGQLVSNRAANRDPAFRSQREVPDKRFDELVRNVYKVLLTRGMVGTVIYAVDPATREALRELIKP